jgi:hypothetical protein
MEVRASGEHGMLVSYTCTRVHDNFNVGRTTKDKRVLQILFGIAIKQESDGMPSGHEIGGFTPGVHGLDSIIVGYYRGKDLIYVARTRNGFVPATTPILNGAAITTTYRF